MHEARRPGDGEISSFSGWTDIPLLGGGLEYFLSFHSIWDNPSQLTIFQMG